MKIMKRALLVVIMATPLLAASQGLIITDGVNRITINLQGEINYSDPCEKCSTNLIYVQPGEVRWRGSIAGFKSVYLDAFTKPILQGAFLNMLADVFASTGGKLKILWSDVGFEEQEVKQLDMCAGGTMWNGTVTLYGYADNNNVAFGEGIVVGKLGPFHTQVWFGGPIDGPGPGKAPFSLTEAMEFHLHGDGHSGSSLILKEPPSGPSGNCSSF
jgi:hypothetical protein